MFSFVVNNTLLTNRWKLIELILFWLLVIFITFVLEKYFLGWNICCYSINLHILPQNVVTKSILINYCGQKCLIFYFCHVHEVNLKNVLILNTYIYLLINCICRNMLISHKSHHYSPTCVTFPNVVAHYPSTQSKLINCHDISTNLLTWGSS